MSSLRPFLSVGLALLVGALPLPTTATEPPDLPSSHLFAVVDTSKSMQQSDPQRFAVLGVMIAGALLDAGDRLTVVRFPDVSEFCSKTGKVDKCGGPEFEERRPHSSDDECDLCDYDRGELTNLYRGQTIALDFDTQPKPTDLYRHLVYTRNATVYEPSLDAVAHRIAVDPTRVPLVLLLTDGKVDPGFHPPSYVWNRLGLHRLSWAGLVLLGPDAKQPDVFQPIEKFEVSSAEALLESLALLHSRAQRSTATVSKIENNAAEIFVPADADRTDVVLVANSPIAARVPSNVGKTEMTLGTNGHGWHFAALRIHRPTPGKHTIALSGHKDAIALVLHQRNYWIELAYVPESITPGEKFLMAGRVFLGMSAKQPPTEFEVSLLVNRNHAGKAEVDENGVFRGEAITGEIGVVSLQAGISGPEQFAFFSPPQTVTSKPVLDFGTVQAGTTKCVETPYEGDTCFPEYFHPAVPAVGTHLDFAEGAKVNPETNCSAAPTCLSVDLWAKNSHTTLWVEKAQYWEARRDQLPEVEVRYLVHQGFTATHATSLAPVPILMLALLWRRRREKRKMTPVQSVFWIAGTAAVGFLVASQGPWTHGLVAAGFANLSMALAAAALKAGYERKLKTKGVANQPEGDGHV